MCGTELHGRSGPELLLGLCNCGLVGSCVKTVISVKSEADKCFFVFFLFDNVEVLTELLHCFDLSVKCFK